LRTPPVNDAIDADEVLGVVLVDAVVAVADRVVVRRSAGDVLDADVADAPPSPCNFQICPPP
jgi:hypothetical protein